MAAEPKTGRGRAQLLMIALAFFGPLLLATWMYQSGIFTPGGRTNYGELLEPVTNLHDVAPGSPVLAAGDGHWLMLYRDPSACAADCEAALYRLRQTRLMLGNEMDRVLRVFLHGVEPPDTVFIEGEHPGLITMNDKGLSDFLASRLPPDRVPGGIFLVDPLGNLVMYFPPDLDPRDMVDDMKHLLELSRIG